jgi:hypothetical protein
MTDNLKNILIQTAKELQPLINQLPENDGENNYKTYLNILSRQEPQEKKKFTAMVLMYCDGVNMNGLYQAMKVLNM